MTSTTGRSAKRRWRSGAPRGVLSGGFTLLELILVMMIICMVLAMAAPSLRGFLASRQTADAAAQMVSLAQYARAQSAARGAVYRLNLDPTAGTYWLTAQQGGVFSPLGAEFGRTFQLPSGTQVTWELGGKQQSGAGYIPFYPDGRTETVTIHLAGERGERVDVVCAGPAERFKVVMLGQEGSS